MKTSKKVLAILLAITLFFSAAGLTVNAGSQDVTTQSVGIDIDYIFDFIESLLNSLTGKTPNSQSDVEYTIEQGEIFAKKAVTDSSHASTVVELDNGSLVSAWFGGSGEGDDDVRIWTSVYSGKSWSAPVQIATSDDAAHWNPVLQNFGSYIRCYFKVGEDTASWVTKYSDSFDGGKTWTAPAELVEGDTSGGRGPVKNKCLTVGDTIIAGASTEQGKWKAFFDISKDGGQTWTKTDYITAKSPIGAGVEMIQPTMWQDKDGEVHAFFRTKSGKIYRSDCLDFDSMEWSQAYATSLPNNSSGIDCVMTDNGWLWLAYNPIALNGIRNKLIISVSKDNGETWEDVVTLEHSPINIFAEFSYPAIIADGNRLIVTYTYKRSIIKYAFVDFEG